MTSAAWRLGTSCGLMVLWRGPEWLLFYGLGSILLLTVRDVEAHIVLSTSFSSPDNHSRQLCVLCGLGRTGLSYGAGESV